MALPLTYSHSGSFPSIRFRMKMLFSPSVLSQCLFPARLARERLPICRAHTCSLSHRGQRPAHLRNTKQSRFLMSYGVPLLLCITPVKINLCFCDEKECERERRI